MPFITPAQRTDTLPGVKVSVTRYPATTQSAIPVQLLDKKSITGLNSLSVADAARYFAGVSVKDYGGIGGLKTVSIRSLGANQTGVMYDGVLIGAAQGGQVDLGKISLSKIESIVLYNAIPTDILLPARSFSVAGLLQINPAFPVYDPEKKISGTAGFKAGSFGFIDPVVSLRFQPSVRFYSSINGEWQQANGQYPFRSYEAGIGTIKRQNSDLRSLRLEYDAAYLFSDSNRIKCKAYYYHSDRGLPGPFILVNNTSNDRLKDRNFFVQSSWNRSFSVRSKLLINAKYSANDNLYTDPDFQNAYGHLENYFHEKEYYFSAAYSYAINSKLLLSYSGDVVYSKLTRTDTFSKGFVYPKRTVLLNNIAAKYAAGRLEAIGNLLHTYLKDEVRAGANGKRISVLMPSVAVGIQPVATVPVRLRAFYKRIFRAPAFNDLYYTLIGNTALKPEYAQQYDLGITYNKNSWGMVDNIQLTSDLYYNRISDRILAVPRQNLFQWTILNVGKVTIRGIDATVQLYFKEAAGIRFAARFAYSYQQALDRSDKSSDLYNTQLPYTPLHSGSVHLNAAHKHCSVALNLLLSGYRYRLGTRIPENFLPGWGTQDISVKYNFISFRKYTCNLLLELNNIFNRQYEIIRYYPMPRFNYRAGFNIEF